MYQFYQQWQQQKISDQECALHFFLHDYLRKYPHKKLQKRYDMGMLDANMLYQFNFKKVKGKAIDALYAYCQGQWNCQLFTQVLSAVEILTLQSQGIRPLTIIPQDHWQVIEHKSDGFEFFVHDLEHAYMFFFDTHRYQQQCKQIHLCM